MTTYNTGNPVPSADARDRFDNSQTLDQLINSSADKVVTRTGKEIITIDGALRITSANAASAEASASDAKAAASVLSVKSDVAEGMDSGLEFFSVPSIVGADRILTLYRNVSGAPVVVGTIPSPDAVNAILALLKQSYGIDLYELLDDNGFMWGAVHARGFDLPGLTVSETTKQGIELADRNGFVIMEDGVNGTSLGSMEWVQIAYPGIWVLDSNGFAWEIMGPDADSSTPISDLPSSIPYIAKEVCGVAGVPLTLHVASLLAERRDLDPTRITIAAALNPVVLSSDDAVTFAPDSLGDTALLYARPLRGDDSVRTVLDLVVRAAPNPPAGAAPTPKILLVGDSIGNHQGPLLLNQFMTQWGYAPTFVGTYPSSIAEDNGFNRLGAVAEARQGWSSAQFTYADPSRAPILPGNEAAYLAMTKPNMLGYNPFIRAAIESDPAQFVKNGYIVDATFYQSRFSLETPTIVINALNTNDFRDQTPETIYQTIYESDVLLHTRFAEAWPDAKIIRCMPGTARNTGAGTADRDAMWESFYIPAIRAMMDARAFLNNPNITIASSWAYYNQEAGYKLKAGAVDATTGARTTTISDVLHPQGSTRRQYYQYLSGHVACAAVNII